MEPAETPPTLTDTLLTFLAHSPERQYRAFEVAVAIGRPTQPVANELGRLARRGRVLRIGDPGDRTQPTFYRSVGPTS